VSHTLILLRHGQSVWNELNLFTGWYDADLTDQGRAEGAAAGTALVEAGVAPDVVHTSLQVRAIRTAEVALDEMGRSWLPVRRSWRLNERSYGALQGKDKAQTTAEFGADQVKVWRRSYDVAPPALALDDERHPRFDPRYAGLAPDVLPATECLKDVVARMLPYWYDALVPDLASGRTVLVAAHGNSLRALIKHLDQMSGNEVATLEIPTGVPIVYELDKALQPLQPGGRWLGDPRAIAAATEAVRQQGQRA
jgi:2,3-bisphosphoglycerate-dependent phosphoglycerate mutase